MCIRDRFIRELLNKKNETFEVQIEKSIENLNFKDLSNHEISDNLKSIVDKIN